MIEQKKIEKQYIQAKQFEEEIIKNNTAIDESVSYLIEELDDSLYLSLFAGAAKIEDYIVKSADSIIYKSESLNGFEYVNVSGLK